MKKALELIIWTIVVITSLVLIMRRTNPAVLYPILNSQLFLEYVLTNLPTTIVCCAGVFCSWTHFQEKPFLYKYTMIALAIFLGEKWLLPLATWQMYVYLQSHFSATYLYCVSMIMGLLTNSVQAFAIALLLYALFVEKKQISLSQDRLKSMLENDSQL